MKTETMLKIGLAFPILAGAGYGISTRAHAWWDAPLEHDQPESVEMRLNLRVDSVVTQVNFGNVKRGQIAATLGYMKTQDSLERLRDHCRMEKTIELGDNSRAFFYCEQEFPR